MKNVCRILALCLIIIFSSFSVNTIPASAEDIIQGEYCFTYGDKESLMEAKQLTRTLAIRNAIESYRVYVNSTTNVNNFTLTNDLIQTISSGYMKDIKVVSQSVEGRTVCEKIQATVSPRAIEEAIKREVQKRSVMIEDQGIDNNGWLKILNVRPIIKTDLYNRQYIQIEVIVKALQTLGYSSGEAENVFIEYYDKDGNIIGGDKKSAAWLHGMHASEIKTISFGSEFDQVKLPPSVNTYRVWLKKPPEAKQTTQIIKADPEVKSTEVKSTEVKSKKSLSKKRKSAKKASRVIDVTEEFERELFGDRRNTEVELGEPIYKATKIK